MSVQESFDRIAVLKTYDAQIGVDSSGNKTIVLDPTKLRVFPSKMKDGSPGFRIKFKVEKVQGPSPIPNPVSIYIYNIGADSRSIVSKQNNVVILEAGYGQSSEIIFTGNVLRARTRKEGPDYVTQIEAADGLFAFQNSTVNQSFQAGITANSVINTLVGALKSSGVTPGTIQGVPSDGYNQGIVLSGKTVDRLQEICDKHDLVFSIQDGKVTILPYGSDRGTPVVLLSPSTGLIGIPEVRETDSEGKSLVSFKCLMNSKIGLFQKILIQSKFVNGIFTVGKVSQDGDSWGGPWYTEGEAV